MRDITQEYSSLTEYAVRVLDIVLIFALAHSAALLRLSVPLNTLSNSHLIVTYFCAALALSLAPLAIVVVALAEVKLPDESIAYWAVPVLPPHADKNSAMLALAIHDAGRMNFRRVDTLNMKLSPSQFLILEKVDQLQVLV